MKAKSKKRKVAKKQKEVTQSFSASLPSYKEKHPWPKNMEQLSEMLAHSRQSGYVQGGRDMQDRLETQFKSQRERTEVKINLLRAAGQAFGEITKILSNSGYVLNDGGERR